jgi:hypothetical protein
LEGLTFTFGTREDLLLLVVIDGCGKKGRDRAGLRRANGSSELELAHELLGMLLSCAVAAYMLSFGAHLSVLENVTGTL